MKINDEQRDKLCKALHWLKYSKSGNSIEQAEREIYSILSIELGEDDTFFCPLTQNKCREDCAWHHSELNCMVGNMAYNLRQIRLG